MPLLRAVPVMLSAGERATLNKRVRGATTAYRDRLRAQIVLAAARGHPNARIAAGLGISADTVRKWRGAGSPPAAWTVCSGATSSGMGLKRLSTHQSQLIN